MPVRVAGRASGVDQWAVSAG
ncbi:hypothetical protein SHJG_p1050 (plasmid) [Streptomyces hygroscopicus subsp. jinggangensis 5008]|nr:hypothetical protein SHJG_p1050 [Streptomyces hygroscopicus subsp. jinggangensis 5008]AGF68335.1 hypothetical protein SHJGH_p1050 [Streptomyces hygroscopicus subsp. jinggangensis TL01]